MRIFTLGLAFFFGLVTFSGYKYINTDIQISDLKLTSEELPTGYNIIADDRCKSIQATLFFKDYNLYSSFLPALEAKEFQSFKGNKDEGTILYFQYKTEADAQQTESFVKGLIWGGKSPSGEHPEEIIIKKNFLIIWSLDRKSKIKELSKNKVQKILDEK
jgi:hypothetical protein